MATGKRKIKQQDGTIKEYWYLFYTNPTSGKPTKMSSGIEVGSPDHKTKFREWLDKTLPGIEAMKQAAIQNELIQATKKENFVGMEKFIEDVVDYSYHNNRYRTYLLYQDVLKKFGNFMMQRRSVDRVSSVKFSSITPEDIEAYKNERLKVIRGVSVKIELGSLRTAFNIARDTYRDTYRKLMDENPVIKRIMTGKWRKDKRKAAVLSIEEEIKLFSIVDDQNLKDMYFILLRTGFRPGEMLNLKWRNVNIKNRLITIQNHEDEILKVEEKNKAVSQYCTVKRPMKYETYMLKNEDSERTLPMPYDLIDVFTRRFNDYVELQLAKNEPVDLNSFIFMQRDRRVRVKKGEFTKLKQYTVNYLNKRLDKYIKEANKFSDKDKPEINPEIHLYSFRHSKATRLKSNGVHIDDVKKILGHADISTTIENYEHSEVSESVMNAG